MEQMFLINDLVRFICNYLFDFKQESVLKSKQLNLRDLEQTGVQETHGYVVAVQEEGAILRVDVDKSEVEFQCKLADLNNEKLIFLVELVPLVHIHGNS